jgi:hypothetical protein
LNPPPPHPKKNPGYATDADLHKNNENKWKDGRDNEIIFLRIETGK